MKAKFLFLLPAAAAAALSGCSVQPADPGDPGQTELSRLFHEAFDGKDFEYIREALGITFSDHIFPHKIGYQCDIILENSISSDLIRALNGGDPGQLYSGADFRFAVKNYKSVRDNPNCAFIWERLEEYFDAGGPALSYEEVVKLNDSRWDGTLPTEKDKARAYAERRRAQDKKNARKSAARRAQIEKENPLILERGAGTLLRSPETQDIVIIRRVRGGEIMVQHTVSNKRFWDFPDNWELMQKD